MNEDEILLYLYRNIGLYWENELSLEENNDRTSLRGPNMVLRNFFREREVVYFITNLANIPEQIVEENTFYLTDIAHTQVASLIKHLRNSIMHGRYTINDLNGRIELDFRDSYGGNVTMIGKIDLDKLVELINCIKNYE